MIETKQGSAIKTTLLLVGIITILGFLIYNANNTAPLQRPDADCIEWGVEVENPNGTKSWAYTSYDPKDREEAERMAKQMEMEDVKGNRYYTAKCKRYK